MALITCIKCQGQVSTMAEACPHCGYAMGKQERQNLLNSFVEDENKGLIADSLHGQIYDVEWLHQAVKKCVRRCFIKLITPILWLIIPTVLLMLFAEFQIYSAIIMGLIFACCVSVAAPLFRFGKEEVQYEVTHYIGYYSYTTDSNGGWIGAIIGVVAVIGGILYLASMSEIWWPDYPFMSTLILMVALPMVYLIPYIKRIINYLYYRRIAMVTKDKPDIETLETKMQLIEKRRDRDINLMIIIFSSIVVSVVILGVILACL